MNFKIYENLKYKIYKLPNLEITQWGEKRHNIAESWNYKTMQLQNCEITKSLNNKVMKLQSHANKK